MPNAGPNLADFRPVNMDPYATVRGNHSGSSEALNIRNPEPGRHYAWMAKRHDEILRFINEGWRVVPPESPARKGVELDPSTGSMLDSTQSRSDIVLMDIDEEGYRRYQERKAARRRPPESATDKWLEQQSIGHYGGPNRAVHFKAPGHSVSYESRDISRNR